MRKLIMVMIIGMFMLSSLAGHSLAGGPTPQTREYDSWRLTDIRDIEQDFNVAVVDAYPEYGDEPSSGFRTFTLSPDGTTVVALGEIENGPIVCRYNLDSAEVACKTIEPPGAAFRVSRENLSWSPDSRQIALHEDTFRNMVDSDIWVLDVESLTFANMTDDGVYGNWLKDSDKPIALDYTPLWNPVTGDLYFFRSVKSQDEWSVDLYRISKGSTEAELALALDADMVSFTPQNQARVVMSPDGTQIALAPSSNERPLTPGIWLIDLTTMTLNPLTVIFALQAGIPSWVDRDSADEGVFTLIEQIAWGADGKTIIVKMYNPAYYTMWYVANYLTVSVEDGSVTALADYEPFGDQRAFLEAVFGAEAKVVVPGLGFIAPDRGSLFYVTAVLMQQETRFIYAAPIPFGDEPVTIGPIPTEGLAAAMWIGPRVGNTMFLHQVTPNGRALSGSVLLTFE